MKVVYFFGFVYDQKLQAYIIKNLNWPEVFTHSYGESRAEMKRRAAEATAAMMEFYRQNNLPFPQVQDTDIHAIFELAKGFATEMVVEYDREGDLDALVDNRVVLNKTEQMQVHHFTLEVGIVAISFDTETFQTIDGEMNFKLDAPVSCV